MKTRTARLDLPRHALARWLPWLVLATGLVIALPGHALYKVVGADGKVTYTDRIPTEGKLLPVGGQAAAAVAASVDVAMPAELRQATGRYPVTLYTTSGACDPCDAARQLLRKRGVPYAEKQVLSPEDGDALQRLSGGRDVPTLTIGAQTLRGLAGEVWGQYLDSAGYPRESKLPPGYQYPAAAPITERREASAAARAASAAPTPVAAPAPAPAPNGFKF
jgi:glutaredoxin